VWWGPVDGGALAPREFRARDLINLRGTVMASTDRESRRGKTPAERGKEAGEVQRRLKQEAAERRKKVLKDAGSRSPGGPQRPRTSPR
jgi:hypothetical protein